MVKQVKKRLKTIIIKVLLNHDFVIPQYSEILNKYNKEYQKDTNQLITPSHSAT